MAESTYGDSRSERAHRAIELAWRTSRGRHPDVSLLTGGVLFFGTYGDSRSERAHRAIELAWRTSRGRHPDVSLLTGGVLFFGTYGDSRSERAHRAIELAWRPPRGRLRRCASDIELAWQPYYSATLLLFFKTAVSPCMDFPPQHYPPEWNA